MLESSTLLSVQNIETYYGPVSAVCGVSLVVEQGAIVTVLGANGAGKTTVLKTIAGLMFPAKGMVHFEGENITGIEPDKIVRLGIAHVPEGREVFPLLSTEENLRLGSLNNQLSRLDVVYEYFPILQKHRKLSAGFLSGGQQQMLAIGRALMQTPRLIMFDEPSLGLSPKLVHEISEIITRINTEQSVSILLVEQNAKMALQVAQYGYILEQGRVVMENTCERLSASTDVKEFYLGMKEAGVRGQRRWKRRKTWR
ncbi:MAG: ABC transporter ATP-binding protein [Gammaproteobacteria bacterium]|nr:ABC transporter ATP-binding protein [Gammaproteobacteria bacterium]MDE0094108.1 ABC transporter ATP-binding protein [Gammaproteobacteria bacterium]MDE0251855.1 ABC transporter ATP-binding protein [Gammaproteobacteria bacterium]MDE0403136.1 ABC transporter ATP-binding protein [Gammaproteobacteria bacterium]MXX95351.1 ABC transporter ATP-binding protein [Gammaproteobacteria bacterium]